MVADQTKEECKMSMNHWPASGHVIEVTEENLIELAQSGEIDNHLDELFEAIKNDSSSVRNSEIGDKFENAVEKHYGIKPEFIYIDEEAEGLEGVDPETLYLVFSDNDKYVKTVRSEWTDLCSSLGFDPAPASWADFG